MEQPGLHILPCEHESAGPEVQPNAGKGHDEDLAETLALNMEAYLETLHSRNAELRARVAECRAMQGQGDLADQDCASPEASREAPGAPAAGETRDGASEALPLGARALRDCERLEAQLARLELRARARQYSPRPTGQEPLGTSLDASSRHGAASSTGIARRSARAAPSTAAFDDRAAPDSDAVESSSVAEAEALPCRTVGGAAARLSSQPLQTPRIAAGARDAEPWISKDVDDARTTSLSCSCSMLSEGGVSMEQGDAYRCRFEEPRQQPPAASLRSFSSDVTTEDAFRPSSILRQYMQLQTALLLEPKGAAPDSWSPDSWAACLSAPSP